MNAQGLARAIFLDRDGTLNEDLGYVHRPGDWRWLPGVPEALARFRAAGWKLVVVSNQSGLARGYFAPQDLANLERWVECELAPLGAAPDAWYNCPHHPEITGPCACRKPLPGLILQACEELDIEPAASWMLGDRLRDVAAGLAAGCRAGLLRPEPGDAEARATLAAFPGTSVWPGLPAACDAILGKS
ncbi:MAG: HAD family hydrolase [Desulfovibrio sp.]|nr:HAD family hydrolase [Desulfovibrio sp.]